MDRKEFIKKCGLLGISLPLLSPSVYANKKVNINETVVIIGAGAAGLTAAYLLNQKGIRTKILEASPIYGGRMKRTTEFADFPIPTGAEWLHTKRSILNKIVNDKTVEIETITKPYNTEEAYALIDGKREELRKLGFTIDQKFINGTWFDFFEDYIVPSIKETIQLNSPVQSIDYRNETIEVTTLNETISADKIIITVPVGLLKNNSIQFTPSLPTEKVEAIRNVTVWDGCKAFFEFSEKFYPAATGFDSIPMRQGHKLFYDAAYGQQTNRNVMGVFAVGPVAKPYLERQGEDLKNYILEELDRIYDGKATPNFKKFIFQNWTEEPFAQGAYVHYFEKPKNIRALGRSIESKLYFAGDAYTNGSEWSSVHAAANSAIKVVNEITN